MLRNMQALLEMWFILLVAKTIVAAKSARNDTGMSRRIIGGVLASPGEFKFVVGLLIEFTVQRPTMRCTGTVLDAHTILTAGHCISGSRTITVYVDCWNLFKCTNTRTGIGWLHPDYRLLDSISINDIGVVKTAEEIGAQEAIQLAQPAARYSSCTVVGYGRTSNESSDIAQKLLYKLSIIDIVWCNTIYATDSRFENALCSYVQSKQKPYVGDSGGPLLCNNKQVGITSQLIQNGQREVMVWFIPNQLVDWVKAAMKDGTVLHLVSLLVLTLSLFTASMLS